MLIDKELTMNQLLKLLNYKEEKSLFVIRFLLDNEQIIQTNSLKLKLN